MVIYHDKLQTKLGAILAKDLDAIVAQGVYLPFMGNSYSKNQLANWLKRRSDVLEDVRDGNYTDQQIATFVDNVYDSLSASDQVIADAIIAGENYDQQPSDADNYEKLVVIMLYTFVTTP